MDPETEMILRNNEGVGLSVASITPTAAVQVCIGATKKVMRDDFCFLVSENL